MGMHPVNLLLFLWNLCLQPVNYGKFKGCMSILGKGANEWTGLFQHDTSGLCWSSG